MEHEYTEGKDSCLKVERCRNPIECLSWKGALLIHRKRSPFPAGEGKDATPLIPPTNPNLKVTFYPPTTSQTRGRDVGVSAAPDVYERGG